MYAPDDVADVVGHEQGTAAIERDADRATARLAIGIHEATQHLGGKSHRTSVLERDEHHLVTVEWAPVPRAVFANEGATGIVRRKAGGTCGWSRSASEQRRPVLGKESLLAGSQHLRARSWPQSRAAAKGPLETSDAPRSCSVGRAGDERLDRSQSNQFARFFAAAE